MNILAIETSCDETALSIITTDTLETNTPNFKVLSDLVISQIDIHAEYGGVFPAMAKREHAKNLIPLFEQCLKESDLYHPGNTSIETDKIQQILEREPELFADLDALFSNIDIPQIDMIMVTHGPGLAPALWVGVNFARALSMILKCPLLPVNHMEGHITSILLKDDYLQKEQALLPLDQYEFPMIGLLISGGHTQIILIKDWCQYEILGETIDDAVGEAFDKAARMLGMKYPGGPKISLAASKGQDNPEIKLPRPMIHSGDYRFSFSGLKTAVRYLVQEKEKNETLSEDMINDIAYEFEHAVAEVLIKKTFKAILEHNAAGLIIAGGVSANTYITNEFSQKAKEYDINIYLPEKKLCGDNSLMIATAGFINYWKHQSKSLKPASELQAESNLKL